MPARREPEPCAVERVTRDLLVVLPLLRKRFAPSELFHDEAPLRMSHAQVLNQLEMHGTLSVTEISIRLGIAKPNITPLIDHLVALGCVQRMRDTVDRRVVNIILLDHGREMLKEVQDMLVAQINAWTVKKPATAFKDLDAALARLAHLLVQE